jgi:ligand-binding sensor domain-containing protein
MIRRPVLRLLLLVLAASIARPVPAAASGPWSTWIRMATCNDVLALRDTVWLASGEAGIVRWLRSEGRFESVTREPGGLASNGVTAVTFDRSGRLWAGTAGKGASRLSANGRSWDLVNSFDGLPSDSVTVLRADGDTIWMGTTRGIALWNGRLIAGSVPDIGTPSPFRSNDVTGIVVFGDSLFVSTTDGVYIGRLSENLSTWVSADAGLVSTNVRRLATGGGEVIALAGTSLYAFDVVRGDWYPSSTGSQAKNLRDGFGRVFAATRDSLCIRSNGTWVALANGPKADASADGGVAVGGDADGHVFAEQGGVLLEQAPTWIQRTPPAPAGNDVDNIAANGSEVWVATSSSGMSRYHGGTWTNFFPGCCGPGQNESFESPLYSYTLQYDRSGHVWTSHWNTAIERIDLRANPLYFDHAFSSWGIDRSDTLSRHSDGWSSAVDSSGYVYIGGDTPELGEWEPMGIDVYDTTGAAVINWKTTNAGLRSNQVRAIAFDRLNNLLWAGFANRGVSYVSLNEIDSDPNAPGNDHLKLPAFTAITSLVSANIFGMVAHGDSIWVLTSSDLKRLRGSTRSLQSTLDIIAQPAPIGSVHPLDVGADGGVWAASVTGVRHFFPGGGHEDFDTGNSPLADDEVRALSVEPKTGVVWFGTASGVNRYDPGYTPPAPPQITALQVTVYPNPARLNATGVRLQLKGNAGAYSGEILDLNGRIVKRFASATDGDVVWDGRDRDGNLVRSGVYFVHTHGGGHDATARVVVLR